MCIGTLYRLSYAVLKTARTEEQMQLLFLFNTENSSDVCALKFYIIYFTFGMYWVYWCTLQVKYVWASNACVSQ